MEDLGREVVVVMVVVMVMATIQLIWRRFHKGKIQMQIVIGQVLGDTGFLLGHVEG